MNSGIVLKVKDLAVELGGERVIDDLSFEVGEGEIFVILGPNGAGKTVLLRTLLDLLSYTGEIKWKEGVKIGYVPQRLPFIKDFPLSVEEFFKFKESSSEKINTVLEAVGLESEILKKPIGNLSSGQFQRVLIAWGLIADPNVLLFDEPTAGVDLGGEETIYTFLNKLKKERGLTVFLVTHDLSIVYHGADRVLCLNHKKICYGLPKEVLASQNLANLFGGEVKFFEHG